MNNVSWCVIVHRLHTELQQLLPPERAEAGFVRAPASIVTAVFGGTLQSEVSSLAPTFPTFPTAPTFPAVPNFPAPLSLLSPISLPPLSLLSPLSLPCLRPHFPHCPYYILYYTWQLELVSCIASYLSRRRLLVTVWLTQYYFFISIDIVRQVQRSMCIIYRVKFSYGDLIKYNILSQLHLCFNIRALKIYLF